MSLWKKLGGLLVSVMILGTGTPLSKVNAASPNSGVNVSGTPQTMPKIPANAIRLKPGESIPLDAPIGQAYIIPPRHIPKSVSIVHVDPGQGYKFTGSVGTVAVIPDPSYPTFAVVAKPPSGHLATAITSNTTTAIPSGVKNHTAVMTAYYPVSNTNGCTYSANTGGILDFNTWWIADNHVYSCYNKYTGRRYNPSQLDIFILNSSGSVKQELVYHNLGSVVNQQYGLASPTWIVAPITATTTIVKTPTLDQWDTAVSGYTAGGSFGWFTQPLQLLGRGVYPPGNPYPDPSSAVYDKFSNHGNLSNGWSGSGTWDNSGRLIAINTFYDETTGNTYGFDGQDIMNFLNQVGIPYNEYTE